jgi:hypothetical protein
MACATSKLRHGSSTVPVAVLLLLHHCHSGTVYTFVLRKWNGCRPTHFLVSKSNLQNKSTPLSIIIHSGLDVIQSWRSNMNSCNNPNPTECNLVILIMCCLFKHINNKNYNWQLFTIFFPIKNTIYSYLWGWSWHLSNSCGQKPLSNT